MPDENTTTEEQESAEDILKRQKEEQLKEDEEDEEEFHLHMGKIMGINAFTHISTLNWDKSYDSPTATSKVDIHYPKENLKDMVKTIYKGVSCKIKLRRSTDTEFKTTKIEEYGLDEKGIQSREHYPTKEQREEISAELNLDELLSGDEQTTAEEAEDVWDLVSTDLVSRIMAALADMAALKMHLLRFMALLIPAVTEAMVRFRTYQAHKNVIRNIIIFLILYMVILFLQLDLYKLAETEVQIIITGK